MKMHRLEEISQALPIQAGGNDLLNSQRHAILALVYEYMLFVMLHIAYVAGKTILSVP